MKKGITKIYKKEIELSEEDILLNERIHKDWYNDDEMENRVRIIKNGKGSWEGEAIPITIDDAIETLNELKERGSNYCEIMYHSDHNGYVFNGIEIRQSTKEEIEEYNNKGKKKKKIEKEMDVLKREFELKNKELSKLLNNE